MRRHCHQQHPGNPRVHAAKFAAAKRRVRQRLSGPPSFHLPAGLPKPPTRTAETASRDLASRDLASFASAGAFGGKP
jgi:hypothetical protein